MAAISFSTRDSYQPDETALIDAGLSDANDAAAPLHEVQPISCFARTASGQVIGGAIGRRWGSCCELQQLWVEPAHRRRGLGTQLVQSFEAHARKRRCTSLCLETFNFQAPELYQAIGYAVAFENSVYPHGVIKYVMVKHVGSNETAA